MLCYNYKWYSSKYFLQAEYETHPDRLSELFEDDDPLELEFTLKGLPEHTTYYITRKLIGNGEGSLLHEWSNFQYEETTECRRYLKQACFPRMSMVKQTVRNQQLVVHERLRTHEVSLLYISSNL